MRLLVLNIRTDADDTALGFTTAWVNALAERCERVHVVTMRTGRVDVRDNVTVHSLDYDRVTGAAARAAAFYRTVVPLVRRERVQACFAHMTPLPAILFNPVGRALGVPTLLWYAHKSVPRQVRVAERLVDRVVSSTPEGFRLPSAKVRFVGQGIDTRRFAPPAAPPADYDRTALSVGRISPIKNVDQVVAAVVAARTAGTDLVLELVGEPLTAGDAEYLQRLRQKAPPEAVRFAGRVPFAGVPAAYHRGWLFLSLSESGSMDKALLEAMASGCIPLSRNDAFRALAGREGLSQLVPEPGPEGLAVRISELSGLGRPQREALRARLRETVVRDHGLDRLADRLMAELTELAAR